MLDIYLVYRVNRARKNLGKGAGSVSRKRSTAVFLLTFAGLAAMVIRCANPVDEPPLRWRSNIQVPVTNERFVIGEELDNLFLFEDLDILNVDERCYDDLMKLEPDTIKGDTVVFSALNLDSAEFESHEEPFADKLYHVNLGLIPVTGAPVMRDTFPVPAVADTFSLPLTVTLDSVYSIDFADTAANRLEIELTNTGGATFTDVTIGITGVAVSDPVTINPQQSAAVTLDMRDKTIGHTADLVMKGASDGAAAGSLAIAFSLNGLLADQLTVNDHLINFTVEYINPYVLTDTVNVHYIDIADGFFSYKILNYTSLNLRVRGIHEHMWTTSFSRQHGFSSVDDLTNLSSADSLDGFLGKITDAAVIITPNVEETFSKENLSSCRMFTEWDPDSLRTVTRVRYIVSSGVPQGDSVTLKATDSLLFTISTQAFKFKELEGVLTETYERQSDTQKVAINLPWNNSVKDELRGKFLLKKVWGDIMIRTGMPEGAYLDALHIQIIAYSPDSTSVRDSTAVTLVNVGPDSTFRQSIDITNVANAYSDSIALEVRVNVPEGTRMRVVNDLEAPEPDFDKYIGRMKIHIITSARLNAQLNWQVDSMVNMDLGSSRFPVPEAMRYFSKFEDRSAEFEMWLTNNSNLNLSLLALVAPDALMDTLDSLPMSEVYSVLKHSTAAVARGFVKLFGDTGISVPKRDTSWAQHNVVLLNDQQLETILTTDSLNFRWIIQFREQDPDALTDTDYVDMKSRLRVSGINTTDSLLIWE